VLTFRSQTQRSTDVLIAGQDFNQLASRFRIFRVGGNNLQRTTGIAGVREVNRLNIQRGIIILQRIRREHRSLTIIAVNLTAVASRTLAKAEAFGEKYGFEKVFGSYEELAKDVSVEAVYIATPMSSHFGDTMLCLENGKNVLCEKSIALNCDELDCVTFVEYVAAMSKTGKDINGDLIEDEFADYVMKLRYRDGEIDGYSSRLHYMTEWVENGVKAGILEDVTAANSNYRMTVKVGYMTDHPNLYPQLSASQSELSKMKAIEAAISGKEVSYIPQDQLPHEGFRWINDGDIILFTTTQNGLDVAHCGIAFNISGKLTLLHASSKEQKVTVSRVTSAQIRQTQTWEVMT